MRRQRSVDPPAAPMAKYRMALMILLGGLGVAGGALEDGETSCVYGERRVAEVGGGLLYETVVANASLRREGVGASVLIVVAVPENKNV